MSPTQSPSPGVPGPIPARRRRLRAVFAADVANFGGMVTIDETKTSRWTLAHAQSRDRGARNPRRLALRTARRRHFRAVREHGGRGALRLAHSVPPGGIAEALCSQACASACIWARCCFRTSCPSARRWSSPPVSKAWPNRAASWSRLRSWKRSPSRIMATFVEAGIPTLKHSPRRIETFRVLPPPPTGEPRQPKRPSTAPSHPNLPGRGTERLRPDVADSLRRSLVYPGPRRSSCPPKRRRRSGATAASRADSAPHTSAAPPPSRMPPVVAAKSSTKQPLASSRRF